LLIPAAGAARTLGGGEQYLLCEERGMRKIEAIIKPFRLRAVQEALAGAGIEGFTVSKVRGCGRQKGPAELHRGSAYIAEFLPKLKVETLVDDYKAAQVVEVIKKAVRTGWVGDEQVFVLSVDEVMRIRTGERGSHAL